MGIPSIRSIIVGIKVIEEEVCILMVRVQMVYHFFFFINTNTNTSLGGQRVVFSVEIFTLRSDLYDEILLLLLLLEGSWKSELLIHLRLNGLLALRHLLSILLTTTADIPPTSHHLAHRSLPFIRLFWHTHSLVHDRVQHYLARSFLLHGKQL